MKPIPETIDTAAELSRYDPDLDVLSYLQATADEVKALVPHCIGLSLAWLAEDVAFTLVASDEEIAVLDGLQYLEDGPCVDAVRNGRGVEVTEQDFMSERGWQLFAQAAAAHTVRSTLTLPLVTAGQVTGSANLYAASDHAFEGHHQALAAILGASAAHAVRNADLTFSSRAEAERSPAAVRAHDVVDMALGILVSTLGLDDREARERLVDAAARAGLTTLQFAQALVNLY